MVNKPVGYVVTAPDDDKILDPKVYDLLPYRCLFGVCVWGRGWEGKGGPYKFWLCLIKLGAICLDTLNEGILRLCLSRTIMHRTDQGCQTTIYTLF